MNDQDRKLVFPINLEGEGENRSNLEGGPLFWSYWLGFFLAFLAAIGFPLFMLSDLIPLSGGQLTLLCFLTSFLLTTPLAYYKYRTVPTQLELSANAFEITLITKTATNQHRQTFERHKVEQINLSLDSEDENNHFLLLQVCPKDNSRPINIQIPVPQKQEIELEEKTRELLNPFLLESGK